MSEPENNRGCLFALLQLFRGRSNDQGKEQQAPQYRLRDDFLSPAEAGFYHLLHQLVADRAAIFVKVGLGDLIYAPRQEGWQSAWNRINRKHIDFVLCDPQTLHPLVAIELDDRSHQRADRVERDTFVDQVLRDAGLVLERVPARRGYDSHAIQEQLDQALKSAGGQRPMPSRTAATDDSDRSDGPAEDAHTCERCGGTMKRRQATHGIHSGKSFWGCSNYPRCRHVVPID